jgi:hypothetical protein
MAQEKVWIIQKRIDADTEQYENWPGYSETPMTYKKMQHMLKECKEKWPFEFRAYNTKHDAKEA